MSARGRRLRADRWLLAVLLVLLLVGAATTDRSRWPSFVGDEATYVMQAESLAWDGDLVFEPADLERFRTAHRRSPEVILHSGDGGQRVVYGKPFLYALAVSPWVRLLGGLRGAVVANALFLAVAAILATLALERMGVGRAALWVAAFCFASVAFGHVFWIHPDLFLMCSTAAGLALAHLLGSTDRQPAADPARHTGAWLLVGALLAVAGATRPPYLALLLVGGLLVPPGHRRWGVSALAAGALAVLLLAAGGHRMASGGWSPYGGERGGFSQLEGFPGVDFPREQWSQQIEARGNTSWLEEGAIPHRVDELLLGWNWLYFLFGRTVGILPYFLPLLVALVAAAPQRRLWVAPSVALIVSLAFLVVRPFNFWGGAGALANRYFLPLYPLFWFGGLRGGVFGPLTAVALAAPFLWSVWPAPSAYPLRPAGGAEVSSPAAAETASAGRSAGLFGGYRHVSPFARRWLPVETTQRHVKAPGRPDVVHHGLWVRFLDGDLAPAGANARALRLSPGRWGELLVGSPAPLSALRLRPAAPSRALFRASAAARSAGAAPDGSWLLLLDEPTARHRMWWTRESLFLYHIRLRAEAAREESVLFELRGVARDVPASR